MIDEKDLGLKINVEHNPTPEIGIDTDHTLLNNIIGAAQVSSLDVSSIDALTQSAQTREQTYALIDQMAQDSRIASVLECYTGDTVQPNDRGQVVWAESDNTHIANYVNWLIDTLNVDKHINQWAYCLITYGDVYLRLFRKSDVEQDKLFGKPTQKQKLHEAAKETRDINEDINLHLYADDDKYINYVKMVENPGEMFDLQKFGKTHGYIKTPVRVTQQTTDETYNYLTNYKMKQSEVEIYDSTTFVHGCLLNTNQRQPETVTIFLDNLDKKYNTDYNETASDYDSDSSCSYDVKRGQSILYNSFKTWRQLNLLELSALLNRLTRSSLVRVLNIEIGDMPKNQVEAYVNKLKTKIEQKSAMTAGQSFSEYVNAGPIENTIYVPTHEGKGAINTNTIGGDFDPKSLTDLEYFKNMLYGSLRVPKQFFSETDDSTGFNGGSSLTIISARYGKEIKMIQNILCQLISDLINLFLIDRKLDNYVNKFTIKMQSPVTQEELDKRANNETRVRYVSDLMQQLDIIEDPLIKIKAYKAMLNNVLGDPEILNIIQEYIDKLDAQEKAKAEAAQAQGQAQVESTKEQKEDDIFGGGGGNGFDLPDLSEPTDNANEEIPAQESFDNDDNKEIINEEEASEESNINVLSEDKKDDEELPSPAEIENIDWLA